MSASPMLAAIVRYFRSLDGITRDAPSGDGVVLGTDDRWIFEVQPDVGRWGVVCRFGAGAERQTAGWRFDKAEELEASREMFAWIAASEAARLTPEKLVPGDRYVILQAFVDHAGRKLVAGQKLSFDGTEPLVIVQKQPSLADALAGALGRAPAGPSQGIVLRFGKTEVALHELKQRDVLSDFAEFFGPA